MTGEIELEISDLQGNILDVIRMRNVVVNGVKPQLTHLLVGQQSNPLGGNRYIDHMQFGVGSQTEDASDTSLKKPILPLVQVTPNFISGNKVTYVAILQPHQANGFSISEAGLRSSDLTLIARKAFTPQVKSATKTFTFRWTLQY